MPRARRRTWFASGLTGMLTAGAVFALVAGSSVAIGGSPAQAAEASSSALTIAAKDYDPEYQNSPFPDLAISVSQTKNLVSQGIQISWSGGRQSVAPGQTGGEDFLQIFQCWGDDPSDPTRPDRTTCLYGATLGPGATRDTQRESDKVVDKAHDAQFTIPSKGVAEPAYTSIPFRAPDGTTVTNLKVNSDGTKSVNTDVSVNTNQYFTAYTTNEVPWAPSGADGRGSVSFEVQTAMQSSGLSCGTPKPDNLAVGESCWLVAIPRGASDNGSRYITQSGLFWDTWKHAIAFRLDFRPLGARCEQGTAERQIFGSELISLAVSSWQPTFCRAPGGSVLALVTGSESDALRAAASKAGGGLVVTTRPLQGADGDPLVYAPIALSGLSIGFTIDRFVNPNVAAPPEVAEKDRLPITKLRLTPRLLAKLLTNSYRAALPLGVDAGVVEHNPWNVSQDPEFLAVNDPEWASLTMQGYALGDLMVPQGRSDAAWVMWQYISADPQAAAFLAGTPDQWGMVVNPWSSTDPAKNASGAAFTVPREDFPKADPIERPSDSTGGAVNLITWRPYTSDLDASGYLALRGDGQLLGSWDFTSPAPKWGKAARALPGRRQVLALTSDSAAQRYQVVTAELQNSAGAFVAPSTESMLAAASAMVPDGSTGQVRRYDSASPAAKAAFGAYPLTVPLYAAANPDTVSADARNTYVAFIRFAAEEGQTPGDGLGQLPRGYAPLPDEFVAQAMAAADLLANGRPAINAPTTSYIPSQSSPAPQRAMTQPAASQPTGDGSGAGSAVATGNASGALSAGSTPTDPESGGLAAAVPLSALAGVAGAAAVPLITRLRRRVS